MLICAYLQAPFDAAPFIATIAQALRKQTPNFAGASGASPKKPRLKTRFAQMLHRTGKAAYGFGFSFKSK